MASLFGRNRLRERAEKIETSEVVDHIAVVQTWLDDYDHGTLKKDKEISRAPRYNADFFMKILGYKDKPATPHTFEAEHTTSAGQFPDGTLRYTDASVDLDRVFAVVELKGAAISLDRPQQRAGNLSPVQQAFKYKPQYSSCPFVVVSNFFEFRLYNDNQLDYEVWTLRDLVDPADDYLKFKQWYVLLHADNMVAVDGKSATERLLSDIRQKQEEIGKQFYADYKKARTALLQDIWRKNEKTRPQFGLAIQKAQTIIDRIVFACFAEDCGLLPDDTLARVGANAKLSPYNDSLWEELKDFFSKVDRGSSKLGIPHGYGGGLFAHDPMVDALEISDEPLEMLVAFGGYNFAEDLRVNILGQIFEQSITDLEEIKRRTREDTHPFNAVATESKVGKRKKEGVFYTPEYVVRYIIDKSVGDYLRQQEEALKVKHRLTGRLGERGYEARQIQAYTEYQYVLQNLRVLDPACGSGAFLVGVFEYLLAENQRVDDILGGNLTSVDDFVRSILSDNIFGVDINEESVEITKLSLWLKTAKKGKELTALDQNIKCGNSLVSDENVAGTKAFDWQLSFPDVFKRGGFDVVIGNPPYVRVQHIDEKTIEHFFSVYKTPSGKLDLSILFFEKALDLIKPDGRVSFISSSQWMQADYGKNIRKMLGEGLIEEIVDFGSLPVFEDASTYPAIYTMIRDVLADVEYTLLTSKDQLNHSSILASERRAISYSTLAEAPWQLSGFDLPELLDAKGISYSPLSIPGKAYYGCKTGLDKAFILTAAQAKTEGIEPAIALPYAYQGGDVERYSIYEPGSVVIYPYNRNADGKAVVMTEDELSAGYPNAHAYLSRFKEELKLRKDSRKLYAAGDDWFRHVRPGNFSLVDAEKFIFKGIDRFAKVGLLKGPSAFAGANVPCVIVEDSSYSHMYLLGILNSSLCTYYLNSISPRKLNGTWRYNTKRISEIPIVGKTDAGLEQLVESMVAEVESLENDCSRFERLIMTELGLQTWPESLGKWYRLDFNAFLKALRVTTSLSQKDDLLTFFEKYRTICGPRATKVDDLQSEIDRVVYGIYGLGSAEIAVVEQATSALQADAEPTV